MKQATAHDIDMLRARVLELEREMERLRADSSALRERLAALEARDDV